MTAHASVGVVGVGNMGAPMARNIAKSGIPVVLFDVQVGSMASFRGDPAFAIADSLRDVGRRCRIVITMLPNSDVVRAAALGSAAMPGLVDGMAGATAGTSAAPTIIDMSSSFAPATRELGVEINARGVSLVDAPVSGGVPKAKTGTLAIMAGGSEADLDRVEPVLKTMGTVIRTGALGSGHAMKALNNYVSAAGLIATCEALLIGERFGLAPETIARVLNASTGRNNTTENKLVQYLIPRAFTSGFTLDLMAKDIGMAKKLADGLGLAAHELACVADLVEAASRALGGAADHTALMAHVERMAAAKPG